MRRRNHSIHLSIVPLQHIIGLLLFYALLHLHHACSKCLPSCDSSTAHQNTPRTYSISPTLQRTRHFVHLQSWIEHTGFPLIWFRHDGWLLEYQSKKLHHTLNSVTVNVEGYHLPQKCLLEVKKTSIHVSIRKFCTKCVHQGPLKITSNWIRLQLVIWHNHQTIDCMQIVFLRFFFVIKIYKIGK